MKTAAELIVDTAGRHLPARVAHHLEGLAIAGASVCAEQEFERHRGWKLRRAAETAVNRIVISDYAGVSSVEQFGLDRIIGAACLTQPTQLGHERSACFTNVVLSFSISFRDASQNSRKSRDVVTILRWKVCTAVKRHGIRRETDSHP